MKEEYSKYWTRYINIYKSNDGEYEAHRKHNGRFDCYKDGKLFAQFNNEDDLNDFLGYSRLSVLDLN